MSNRINSVEIGMPLKWLGSRLHHVKGKEDTFVLASTTPLMSDLAKVSVASAYML